MSLCCAALLSFSGLAQAAGNQPAQHSGAQISSARLALPDPLRPAIAPSAALAGEADTHTTTRLILQAIRVGPAGRYVVINGERFRVGDRVGDAVVLRIDAHAVRLLRDDDAELDIAFDAPGMDVRRVRSNR